MAHAAQHPGGQDADQPGFRGHHTYLRPRLGAEIHVRNHRLGGFGLGFVLGGSAKGQSLLLTLVAEGNAVAAATLLNSIHRCGSNVTATLFPICSH